MCASPIGKQIELLFLDTVFHVTPGTVKLLVEGGRFESGRAGRIPPAIGRQIGHDKARITPLGKISAFPITRRFLLQLVSVEYSNSV